MESVKTRNSDRLLNRSAIRCPCNADHLKVLHTFSAPPPDEVTFEFSATDTYQRVLKRCDRCGHITSEHEMDVQELYAGDYVTSNYGDAEGIGRTFERIVNLPESESDNKARAKRVIEFASRQMPRAQRPTVLDVGSGLCVFLHEMKNAGWDCTALDPDERSARHARETVGVHAVRADFRAVNELGAFDVITFNKVLEHVEDPVDMLAQARSFLRPGGFVYVELPDGERAILDGPDREEFTIDHFHAFSFASIALLGTCSGFLVKEVERLREPSGKYTLRAFLSLDNVD